MAINHVGGTNRLPNRKTIRLSQYDYSRPGAYFVTICTAGRRCILSEICVGDGGPLPSPANETLPKLISTFKRFSNRKCGVQLWQRSYHEHVIRNETDYQQTWEYIDNNPARWTEDRYHME